MHVFVNVCVCFQLFVVVRNGGNPWKISYLQNKVYYYVIFTPNSHLTIRASLAPRYALFFVILVKGPKGPPVPAKDCRPSANARRKLPIWGLSSSFKKITNFSFFLRPGRKILQNGTESLGSMMS